MQTVGKTDLYFWRGLDVGVGRARSLLADRESAPPFDPRRFTLPTMASLGADPAVPFLAGFAALLSRHRGTSDVVVCVGVGQNVVPVRVELTGDPTFRSAVRRIDQALSEAAARANGQCDAMDDTLSDRILGVAAMAAEHEPPSGHGLLLSVDVDAGAASLSHGAAVDPTTVDRMVDQLVALWEAAAAAPDRRIATFPAPADTGSHGQVVKGDNTASPRSDVLVHQRVARWAAVRPDAVAVTDGAVSLTYRELDERAARLADVLAGAGVGPDVPVGVCLPRSPDLVVGLLGVLKAGGAYVALDTDYPAERLAYLVADSAATVVVTTTDAGDRVPAGGHRVIHLDRIHDVPPSARTDVVVEAANLAYVVYTSGSTGRPKGVAVPHAGLSNLVSWHLDRYRMEPGSHAAQVAAAGFDASVWEIWSALAAGATLHIAAEADRSHPSAVLGWLAAHRIAVAFLPTPLAEEVLRLDPPDGLALRTLLTGGDRLVGRPRAGAPYRVVNHYGPTESSVVTTAGPVSATPGPGEPTTPPIGWPIDNLWVHVLDPEMRPVPVGVVGELYIAGVGLARGYVGRAAGTAERFVPDPFTAVPGGRLYRTGDLVRRGMAGTIEFVGRADRQIKINGFRIEPGEVEAQLRACPTVRDAVVTSWSDSAGVPHLVAYLTHEAGPGDVGGLRGHLRQRLPHHLVPTFLVPVDRIPVGPNGKTDLAALPEPTAVSEPVARTPVGPVEELLAALWAEALDRPEIGAHENFFALGGHSLLAGQILARVNHVFDLDLSVQALLWAPTVAEFAEAVEDATGPGRIAAIARLVRQVDELSDEEVERLLAEQSDPRGRPTGGHNDTEVAS
jgi:amino acid adenylation domain-containing protein